MIVYDMEAIFYKNGSEHRPISVCINSDVLEFEDVKFILDRDEDKSIEQIVEYMYHIFDKAYKLAKSS